MIQINIKRPVEGGEDYENSAHDNLDLNNSRRLKLAFARLIPLGSGRPVWRHERACFQSYLHSCRPLRPVLNFQPQKYLQNVQSRHDEQTFNVTYR